MFLFDWLTSCSLTRDARLQSYLAHMRGLGHGLPHTHVPQSPWCQHRADNTDMDEAD